MPFGAAKTLREFICQMADLLFEYIDKGNCTVFIDDIFIYSKKDVDRERHVRAVMDTIRKAGFRLHGSKCSFGKTSAQFLGFDIDGEDTDGASVDTAHEKIEAIADWPYPNTRKEMRSYVVISGIYRNFVPDFAKISQPLMELLAADQKDFDACRTNAARWQMVRKAVDILKATMITRPALALPQKGN